MVRCGLVFLIEGGGGGVGGLKHAMAIMIQRYCMHTHLYSFLLLLLFLGKVLE